MAEMSKETIDKLKEMVIAKKALSGGGVGTDGVDTIDIGLNVAYRNIFINDPQGSIVLKDLLRICKYGKEIDNLYEATLHNLAVVILTKCGLGIDDIEDALIKGI